MVAMTKLRCCFCQQELESVLQLAGAGGLVEEAYLLCSKCNIRGERKLWQELIRTRKALETMQEFVTKLYLSGKITDEQLERYKKMLITALEQKDVK